MSIEKIREALSQLKPDTDMHWTKEGEPVLSFVNVLAKGKFSRDEVSAAWPGFSRTNLNPEAGVQAAPPAPVPPAPPVPAAPPAEAPAAPAAPVVQAAASAPEQAPEKPKAPAAEQDERKKLEARIEKLDLAMDKLRKERAELQDELDAVIRKQTDDKAESFSVINQQYQQSQQAEREARADKLKQLQDLGVTQEMLSAVFPKGAPIDMAMRNRPRR